MSHHHLNTARALTLPSREAMLHRAPSVQQFWNRHRELLSNAWKEWEVSEQIDANSLSSELLDSRLRQAVEAAWEDPSKETDVKALWQEVAPGVYAGQFFDPERLVDLRTYLEKVWDAGIPLRPPYGIVLNRRGAMLDKRSEGYLAAPTFQHFYQELINTYMRPIARLLFPEIVGYDSQSFGFSIHYQPNTDTSIRPHTDASAVTLNINLNLPTETFSGSAINFFDISRGKTNEISFTSGSAMIHRGTVPHAALPITAGERTNFVLWLYGNRGRLPGPHSAAESIEASQRWTIPAYDQDDHAPF